ncbi:hypothetical protein FM110_12605 [Brachybacterium nesterenkovii]|uniref:Uncharacterized protein n=1 Tax=Brachybacterium nesterenkovii TaxID=47847 RepID=A0A1X6X7Y8_9MICO|nr:hypothetical protein FM110_12605 [Brachybacterium nesterenkovii]
MPLHRTGTTRTGAARWAGNGRGHALIPPCGAADCHGDSPRPGRPRPVEPRQVEPRQVEPLRPRR